MDGLHDIEKKLASINEAVFQELCDCYLSLSNNNYKAFIRHGSQIGKQKTIKGTPDTLLLLPNGKYILVEYSTNVTMGVNKLKEDIKKCLDVKRTNIPIESIEEIIICVNFRLKAEDINELNNLLSETEIEITYCTLDSLAIELKFNYRNLAHDYLGLNLDKGQIVSVETFINEYNNLKGISTPLDNPFLHRETDLKELKKLIYENDIVILQGAPGVGKTKLAIETINNFLKENLEYNSFCISNKHDALLDDLYQYLNPEKYYILFVDDANRIDTFCQILGFLKNQRTGKLKIIITVRDYAFDELKNMCHEYNPASLKINKLTDEQIIDIIKEKPFEILFFPYQDDIVRIADGNPRLAIMAALLAKEKQLINALSDVSDLFERYFSTFIKDKEELTDPNNVKILGLIAFFHAIPYKDRELTLNILNNFEIDYNIFINNIDHLDNLEIVSTQYGYVKIQEQNIATFFFYKAFIKDSLLSFYTLLEKYFENNITRFNDCVIPAIFTFGYHNVLDKIQPILIDYWNNIKNNDDKSFQYLSVFCFYLQNETLDFIYNKIKLMPLNNVTSYKLENNDNKCQYNKKNEILELLKNFYFSPYNLKDALELSFEYIRKSPTEYSELINNIRSALIFDIDDEYYGFKRQPILFNLLINGINNKDMLYTNTFCELSKTFLHFKYHHTKDRRHNTITFYNYPLPNNSYIKTFRENIWETIDNNYSDSMFEILKEYLQSRSDIINELMEFDIQYLVKIIKKHLTPDEFEYCRYVQEQIYWCKKIGVLHSDFSFLKSQFRNHLYNMYLIINWNRYRDKEDYDFDDYREYEKLKEHEIRNKFVFNNIEEIESFYQDFIYLCKAEQNNNALRYNNSLDIIIDENFKKDFDLGCKLLMKIMDNNIIYYFPNMIFRNHLTSKEKINCLWNILHNKDFQYKPILELIFFENIPDQFKSKEDINFIKDSISNINYSYKIFFDKIEYYRIYDKNIFKDILSIIVNKNETGGKIYLWYDIFEKYFEQLGDDLELIKKAYFQQILYENIFDYKKDGFLKILINNNYFLLEYVNFLYIKNKDKYHLDDDHELAIIWEVNNIEIVLSDVFDFVCKDEDHYFILKDFCKSFFYNLKEDNEERAKTFLLNYCKINYKNYLKINIINNIIRHTMRDFFSDIIIYFLSLTQNVNLFSEISWRDNGITTFDYDTIFGDIEAAEWKNILSIVEKSDLGIELIPIKQYINSRIESALRSAENERKRKYLVK